MKTFLLNTYYFCILHRGLRINGANKPSFKGLFAPLMLTINMDFSWEVHEKSILIVAKTDSLRVERKKAMPFLSAAESD